jgi:hypothetical protein
MGESLEMDLILRSEFCFERSVLFRPVQPESHREKAGNTNGPHDFF